MYKFLILFFLFSRLLYSEILSLDNENSYKVKDYLSYSLANIDEENIDNLQDHIWYKNKKKFNTFKNWENPYWIKLELKNNHLKEKKYYLQLENELIFHIELFFVKNNKIEEYLESGLRIKESPTPELNDNHILLPLKLNAHESATIFMKVKNFNKRNIHFKIVNEKYLLKFYQQYNFIEALFFGAMLSMAIYTFILYMMHQLLIQLYFSIYIFSSILYFLGLLGYIDNYMPILKPLYLVSYGTLFIFLTFFIQKILTLDTLLPKINKIFTYFTIVFLFITISYFYQVQDNNFFYAQLIINFFFLVLFIYFILLLITIYILTHIKKIAHLRKFFINWSITFMAMILFIIVNVNIIKIDLPVHYILEWVSLVETITLSYLLARYIKEENQKEKLLIQQSKVTSMNEMLSLLSHQWRQPLSCINGIVLNMDIDQRKNILNKNLNSYLNEIELRTNYLSKVIEKYKIIFEDIDKSENFYLIDVIKKSKYEVENKNASSIEVKYNKKNNLKLEEHQSRFIQLFIILFSNSDDASKECAKKCKIEVDTKIKNKHLIIHVKDYSGGIKTEVKDKVFDPYFTTKTNSEGIGLGLYVLKFIVENSLNGKISLLSDKDGCTFTIEVPY